MRKKAMNRIALTAAFAALLGCQAANAKVTIQFASWAGGQEKDAILRSVKEFEKQNPNIKVSCFFTDAYYDKILSMYAAGKAPDVMFIGQIRYHEYAMRNMFMDITPLFKADKDLTRPGYLFQPQENDRMYVNGKAYGIGCGFGAYFTYLNPTTWQKAGLKPPPSDPDENWTFDEFLAQAKKLTQGPIEKPTTWGVEPGLGWWLGTFSWLYSAGSELNKDKTEITLNSDPKMRDALQKLVDLVTKSGAVPKSIAAADSLAKGKLAMYMAGSWDLAGLAPIMNKAKAPLELAPLPSLGPKPSVLLQGHFHCINKTTKHPKEAWKLLKWVSSAQHQQEMVEIGLWPPGRGDLVSPEAVKKWMKPGIHPKSYPDVGVKYIMKYGRAMVAPPGYDKIEAEIWDKHMSAVYQGKKDLKTILPNMVTEMNRAMSEAHKRVTRKY